jgi:hypothetical protein
MPPIKAFLRDTLAQKGRQVKDNAPFSFMFLRETCAIIISLISARLFWGMNSTKVVSDLCMEISSAN